MSRNRNLASMPILYKPCLLNITCIVDSSYTKLISTQLSQSLIVHCHHMHSHPQIPRLQEKRLEPSLCNFCNVQSATDITHMHHHKREKTLSSFSIPLSLLFLNADTHAHKHLYCSSHLFLPSCIFLALSSLQQLPFRLTRLYNSHA